jgi:hypothetical protein
VGFEGNVALPVDARFHVGFLNSGILKVRAKPKNCSSLQKNRKKHDKPR